MRKERIYWHDTVEMPFGYEQNPLPEKVDVAVIGSGITGLSAAMTLAKHGVIVAVLEAESIGWGASSRNGGMVLTGLKIPMQIAIKRYGRDLARRLFQCSLNSIDTVENICKEEKIDCGFARTGHLLTANKPKHYDLLAKEIEFMGVEFNHAVRLVPRHEQRTEIGSDLYYGALVDEVSAGLNPAQYVTGLVSAVEKAGATLHARARVIRLGAGREAFSGRDRTRIAHGRKCLGGDQRLHLIPSHRSCIEKSCRSGRSSSPQSRCPMNWPMSSARTIA